MILGCLQIQKSNLSIQQWVLMITVIYLPDNDTINIAHMQNTYLLLLLLCLFLPAKSQNLLNNPESVVYDKVFDRYLVSNCGDGQIVQIDNNGVQSYFNTQLTYTLGLHIAGDTLFVSSNDGPYSGIVGFLLSSGEIIFHVEIPEKELLNDIASDNAGNLYITDCEANKIFKVDRSSMTYSILIGEGLGYPNGIIFDETNNRLLVLNGLLAGRPILAVSLDDLSMSVVVETGISAIDGLTVDDYGNYYFSSWTTDRVYRYDPLFTNPPEIIAGNFADPADIYYNLTDHLLAIPCFNGDTIIFLPYDPVGVDERGNDKTGLLHVSPNPFTGAFTIHSDLLKEPDVLVSIVDLNGRIVSSTAPLTKTLADKSVMIDGNNLREGVYIVMIRSADEEQNCKIIKQ
jgi:hypothetical protein